MGEGKIQIKKIENPTNRQVTFSKRRDILFKKAEELTVLYDAKVSIIMISNTGSLDEYRSANITTKEVFDRYQEVTGKDLWVSQYQKMQEELRQLKEKNSRLEREMRLRKGEGLSDLSFKELMGLELEMDAAFNLIHERIIKKIQTGISILKIKLKGEEENNNNILFQLRKRCEDVHESVKNEEYELALALGKWSI